jgi:uncharacterized membrane protein
MKKTAGILLLIASIASILVHLFYFFQGIYYSIEYGGSMGGLGGFSQILTGLLNLFLPIALLFVAIWMMKGDKKE